MRPHVLSEMHAQLAEGEAVLSTRQATPHQGRRQASQSDPQKVGQSSVN